MSLVDHYIDGTKRDKIAISIYRLKSFEPEDGYYLAFSGGKDSQCIYHLALEAGVKFDAHYNVTTVDPPELVAFIHENYPDVSFDRPKKSMFQLILEKDIPPSRIQRFCCRELKERGGEGRICVTGVRWAESVRRKAARKPFEIMGRKPEDKMLFDDNIEDRRMFENCVVKGKRIVNPIVDWEDADVWEYIRSRGIKYCKLYDEGFKRLGCIGCPMADREQEFARWPRYRQAYVAVFDKVVENRKAKGKKCTWINGEDLMRWWMGKSILAEVDERQMELFAYTFFSDEQEDATE